MIERAIALGVSAYICPEDLPKALWVETPEPAEINLYEKEMNACKKSIWEKALQKTNGNRNEAARSSTFTRRISPSSVNN